MYLLLNSNNLRPTTRTVKIRTILLPIIGHTTYNIIIINLSVFWPGHDR